MPSWEVREAHERERSPCRSSFAARPRRLRLFSGPTRRSDGIRAVCERVGWDCTDADIVNVGVGDFVARDQIFPIPSVFQQKKLFLWLLEIKIGTICSQRRRLKMCGIDKSFSNCLYHKQISRRAIEKSYL